MAEGTNGKLNIREARVRPWTRRELLGRMLWGLSQPLFRFSPRPCFGWRSWFLRRFGARIGKQVHLYPTTRITIPWHLEVGDWSTIGDRAEVYNLGVVRIGSRVTISQRAYLCAGTHDHTDPALPLLKRGITIEDQAWICADAFVGPGVKVGEGSIVGARSVAVKDVPDWTIVVGNPARSAGPRELRTQMKPPSQRP